MTMAGKQRAEVAAEVSVVRAKIGDVPYIYTLGQTSIITMIAGMDK